MVWPIEVSIIAAERLQPDAPGPQARVVPLSLLDATTADLAFTQATWLFEAPQYLPPNLDLPSFLKQTLQVALSAYPQWCGLCRAVDTPSGPIGDEARHFAPHARRFGRVYACYGMSTDPGVEFVTATSSATLDGLYPADRTESLRLWNRREADLMAFAPTTAVHSVLKPNEPDEKGMRKPLLAVQLTHLSCGGFVLAAKSSHPMADISGLVRLVKDWGKVSRAMLQGEPLPKLTPDFRPELLDACAAGDINAEAPDAGIIKRSLDLPMHRYDWWAKGSAEGCPWPVSVPEVFASQSIEPVGPAMPWKEWDVASPVSTYIIHLTSEQVDYLYAMAKQQVAGTNTRVSKHDAVLAHIWSCVVRARQQQEDDGPVHCDVTIGVRPAIQLNEDFIGSPILLVNVEMTGREAADADENNFAFGRIVRRIRSTIDAVNNREALAAHLHSVAYEKSPQRIWRAFLGSRHMLVTTWARAGVYEIDFGLGSAVRYADGVVPNLDGCVLIKEAPPPPTPKVPVPGQKPGWTDHGVDVSLALRAEDMERLLRDPLLLLKV